MIDVSTFVWLLLIASGVAMAVERRRLPYPIALVLVGLAIGVPGWLPGVRLEPHTLFTLFLPPLLFEACLSLHGRELLADWKPIAVFSLVGTLLATFVGAGVAAWACGLPWAVALVFGAICAPTDPVSVIAMLRQLGAPARLTLLVEAESLFNDGVGVVVFLVVLGLAGGVAAGPGAVLAQFGVKLVGGVVAGVLVGGGVSRLVRALDSHLVEITWTTIAAYGAYMAGEAIGASGVVAVVASGLVVGNDAMRRSMSERTREAVVAFWEYAAFVSNSIVFLLVGIEAGTTRWWQHPGLVGGAIAAVLTARAASVYLLALPFGKDLPGPWRHVLFWGGLRGALSLALALGLPPELPYRDALVAMTFGYVLFSVLAQGLTIGPLVRALGLKS